MPLYTSSSPRFLGYGETFTTFIFDGTGGQVASTQADVGMVTNVFSVATRPLLLSLETNAVLRNGGSKFTGSVTVTIIGVIAAADSPNDGLIGTEVIRANFVHDQAAASNAAINTNFHTRTAVAVPRLYTVGGAGLVAGQWPAGSGYQLKLQMTSNNVTNLSARLVSANATTTPAAVLKVEER